MKNSGKIIILISIIGALACGISFIISLSKEDNLIAEIAFGAACLYWISTFIAAIKKKNIK